MSQNEVLQPQGPTPRPKVSDGLLINTDMVACDTIRMTEVTVSTFKASLNVRKKYDLPGILRSMDILAAEPG